MRPVQSRNLTITEKNHEIFYIGISMFFFGTNSTYTKVYVEFVPDNIHPTNHGNILTNPNPNPNYILIVLNTTCCITIRYVRTL